MITENNDYTVLEPSEFDIKECPDKNRVAAFVSWAKKALRAVVVHKHSPKLPVAIITVESFERTVTRFWLRIYCAEQPFDEQPFDEVLQFSFDSVGTVDNGDINTAALVLLHALDMFEKRIVINRQIAQAQQDLKELKAAVKTARGRLAEYEAKRSRLDLELFRTL